MPKVDLFYLKSTKELYAYSTNKKLVSNFKKERNMKLFYHNREKIPEIAFKAFMSKHNNLMLVELPLYDGNKYYMITGTPKEDFKLSHTTTYKEYKQSSFTDYMNYVRFKNRDIKV